MRYRGIYTILLLLLFSVTFSIAGSIQWHKGQIHCHSTVSDGQVPPATVFSQYKRDGYSFVSLTDHSTNTSAKMSDTTGQNSEGFVAIPGLEITAAGPHVNAINCNSNLSQWWGLQIAIDNAYKSGADLVQLNHPWWSNGKKLDGISDDALKAKGNNLLEVCNADDSTHIPDIAVWDTLLSTGRRIFGTGTDDAHNYSPSSNHYNECWVTVPADTLTVESMMEAMKSGDFYFNDKAMPLTRIDMYDRTLAVYSDEGTEVKFIGKYGKILQTVQASSASYTLPEGDLYIRAEITNGEGTAYTQAHFPDLFLEKSGRISTTGNSKFKPGEDIPVYLEYFNDIDNVKGARLFANGTFIGNINSRQESFIWNTTIEDEYIIKAKIISNDGTYLWSNPLVIVVDKTTSTVQQNSFLKNGNIINSENGKICLNMIAEDFVKVELFSLSGRKITTIVDSNLLPGNHNFNVGNINKSSMYLLKAKIGKTKFVQKIILE